MSREVIRVRRKRFLSLLVAAVMLFLMPVEALAAEYDAKRYSTKNLNVGDIVLSGDRINVVSISGDLFYNNASDKSSQQQEGNINYYYIVKPGIWKVTKFDYSQTSDSIWATYLEIVNLTDLTILNNLNVGDIVENGAVIEIPDATLTCFFRENGTTNPVAPKELKVDQTTSRWFIAVNKEGRWKYAGYSTTTDGSGNTATNGFFLDRVYKVTLSGGANATADLPDKTTQEDVGGSTAMTTVTYTANEGCKFPAKAVEGATEQNYITKNGITVERTSDTVVKVSGTPTADTTITVPDALYSHIVTFKVVNGSWNTGEGTAATENRTVTLMNVSADALKLSADQIPAVGTKPKDNTYMAGSWDVTPTTDTVISEDTTYTYTYAGKTKATATAPKAINPTYTGSAQALVTAGSATGGTMKYAIGMNDTTAPTDGWDVEIPQGTNAGTYYVWYMVKGDANHNDTAPASVTVTIAEKSSDTEPTNPGSNPGSDTDPTNPGSGSDPTNPGSNPGSDTDPTNPGLNPAPTNTSPAPAPTNSDSPDSDPWHYDPWDPDSQLVNYIYRPEATVLPTLTSAGKGKLKLSWTTVKNANYYDVYFAEQGEDRFTLKESVGGKRKSLTLKDLKSGTIYAAYVQAWRKTVEGKVLLGSPSPMVYAVTDGSKTLVNPKKVYVDKRQLTMMGKAEYTLSGRVTGAKRGKQLVQLGVPVRFFSSDVNVAEVKADGTVVAVGAGKCQIYALASNGVRRSVKIMVIDGPTKVRFTKNNLEMQAGAQEDITPYIKLSPNNISAFYSLTTDNELVATVDSNGIVTAVGAGKAVITVTTSNGLTADLKVTVKGEGAVSKGMQIDEPIYEIITEEPPEEEFAEESVGLAEPDAGETSFDLEAPTEENE